MKELLTKEFWAKRLNNPLFIAQLILSVFVPILGYMGLNVTDLTTWGTVGKVLFEAVKNPYVLGIVVVSVFNAVTNPTTKGVGDGETKEVK